MNFLAEPYIDSGIKYQLFHNVLELMLTPYAWDPLGLQEKLRYYILKCVNLKNEKIWHYSNIKGKYKADVAFKNVIKIIYHLLSIEWMEEKKTFPPINVLGMIYEVIEGKKLFNHEIVSDFVYVNKYHNDFTCGDRKYKELMDYLENKYFDLTQEYEKKEYDLQYFEANGSYVKKIQEILKISKVIVPQYEREDFLNYQDLCELF